MYICVCAHARLWGVSGGIGVLLVYMLHVHARGGKWYACLYNLHVTFMHVDVGVSGEMVCIFVCKYV